MARLLRRFPARQLLRRPVLDTRIEATSPFHSAQRQVAGPGTAAGHVGGGGSRFGQVRGAGSDAGQII